MRASLPVKRRLLSTALIALVAVSPACREIVDKEATDKMEKAREAMEREEWESADDFFYEVLLLDESRGDAWVGRAMSLTRLGEKEAAREHYETALRRFSTELEEEPNDFVRLRKKILVLVLLDRIEEAEALAEEAAAAPEIWGREAADLPGLVQTLRETHADMILTASEPETPAENP